MIRRLGLPPDDFSITMCSTIEEYLKEMLDEIFYSLHKNELKDKEILYLNFLCCRLSK